MQHNFAANKCNVTHSGMPRARWTCLTITAADELPIDEYLQHIQVGCEHLSQTSLSAVDVKQHLRQNS